MIHKRSNSLPIFGLFVALFAACGDDAAPHGDDPGDQPSGLKGIWQGAAGGYSVTFDIREVYEQAGTQTIQGLASTNRSECFRSAQVAGTVSAGSAEWISIGAGSVSTRTFIKVTGVIDDATLTGQLEIVGDVGVDQCTLGLTDVIFTKM